MKNDNSQSTGFATMASSIEFIDNYNNWILEKFQAFIGKNLMEIGTGQGNFRNFFPNAEKYISVDIDKSVIERAKERIPEGIFIVADISSKHFVAEMEGRSIDTILCTNVLEHIKEDSRAIRNLLSVLSFNGYLLLFVPAIPFLFNDLDRLVGHYRRYTKKTLESAIGRNGQIVLMEYFNPVGGLGWWANKFVKHQNIDSDQINKQVVTFDRYFVPISKFFNPLTKNVFGQSLLCVIKKTLIMVN